MNTNRKNWIWRTLRLSGLFVRELVGWILMLLGLNVFRITFQYLNYAAVIEGFIATAIGFILFRSGLQLVKVAVAARALRADHGFRYANPANLHSSDETGRRSRQDGTPNSPGKSDYSGIYSAPRATSYSTTNSNAGPTR